MAPLAFPSKGLPVPSAYFFILICNYDQYIPRGENTEHTGKHKEDGKNEAVPIPEQRDEQRDVPAEFLPVVLLALKKT